MLFLIKIKLTYFLSQEILDKLYWNQYCKDCVSFFDVIFQKFFHLESNKIIIFSQQSKQF